MAANRRPDKNNAVITRQPLVIRNADARFEDHLPMLAGMLAGNAAEQLTAGRVGRVPATECSEQR